MKKLNLTPKEKEMLMDANYFCSRVFQGRSVCGINAETGESFGLVLEDRNFPSVVLDAYDEERVEEAIAKAQKCNRFFALNETLEKVDVKEESKGSILVTLETFKALLRMHKQA